MGTADFWGAAAVMAPILAALVALQGSAVAIRLGLSLGSGAALISAAALLALVPAGSLARIPLGGWPAPLGIELRVDGPALVLLLATALVGSAVSLYSTAYFGDISHLSATRAPAGRAARFFAPLWLFLWAGLNGIYLSGDLFNLFVSLEIVGLAAAALVTLAVTSTATVAGMRYLVVSLVGSMLFLLGVALLYSAAGSLAIGELAALDLRGPLPLAALATMTVGLAAKTALFPLHGWLPPAHAAAPAPGSALLSAVVVKGSFLVLLRLWVEVFGGSTDPGRLLLGLLGGGAIGYGSLLALRQSSLKRLVAYSTVAQVGYLFLLFPLLLEGDGQVSRDAWSGGIYWALAHALAKGAMFLAAGSMSYAVARDDLPSISGVAHRLPVSFMAFGLGGLSLAGIPPSGGFVAKWLLLRAAVSQGGWGWAVLVAAGGLLTVAYTLRVLRWAARRAPEVERFRPVPARMEWAAMALALLAVLLGIRAGGLIALLDPLALTGTGG